MKKNLELILAFLTMLFTAALFICMMLYLTTYDCTEMTQPEWLNWLFTGKEV